MSLILTNKQIEKSKGEKTNSSFLLPHGTGVFVRITSVPVGSFCFKEEQMKRNKKAQKEFEKKSMLIDAVIHVLNKSAKKRKQKEES